MKKTGWIIFLLVGCLAATAQNTSLGPTVGINGWTDANNNVKVGLNVGATFTYSIDPHWGLGADLKFSMEGGGKTVDNKMASMTENYIRVPLKAMYFFGHYGQRFRPKLYAGPSFGFLLGGKIDGTYSGLNYEVKTTDYIKTFDLGILVGTGFNYRLSKGTWLNVDLGYTGGLLNVVKTTTSLLPSIYNHSLALNVGVAFPIGGTKHVDVKSKKGKR